MHSHIVQQDSRIEEMQLYIQRRNYYNRILRSTVSDTQRQIDLLTTELDDVAAAFKLAYTIIAENLLREQIYCSGQNFCINKIVENIKRKSAESIV